MANEMVDVLAAHFANCGYRTRIQTALEIWRHGYVVGLIFSTSDPLLVQVCGLNGVGNPIYVIDLFDLREPDSMQRLEDTVAGSLKPGV